MDTQSEAHTRRPTAGRSSRLLPPAGSWRAAFWQHPIAFWPLWWLFRHQKNLNQVDIGHRSAPGSFLFPANPHWPIYSIIDYLKEQTALPTLTLTVTQQVCPMY